MSRAVLFGADVDGVGADMSVTVGVLERLEVAAAHGDPSALSDDELLGVVGAAERARRRLDAAVAHAVAELDARGVTDERRGLRTGQWIALETHEPIPEATRWVSIAVRIRDEFTAVDEAFTAGRIGRKHVGVLVEKCNDRIKAAYIGKLPWLIGLAEDMAFKPWVREVALVAARLDFDGGYRPENDPDGSKLYLDRLSGDDVTLIRGAFVGASGTSFAQIIEERTDQIWRRYQHDHTTTNGAIKIPSRPSLRAKALEELVLEARAADPTKTKAPVTDLTVVLRWDVSDLYPDGITPGGAFPGGADTASLLAAGRYRNPRHTDVYETFDGCDHCESTMADRLCDPAITFLLTNEAGVPLNLGHTVRFATDDQRRAAKARDGGCTFPGCDRPGNWCDLHHVDGYLNGGPTDIVNLACLCRFHHGVTHRTGWHMHATTDGWFWWTTPHGDTIWGQRHQQPRAGPTPNAP